MNMYLNIYAYIHVYVGFGKEAFIGIQGISGLIVARLQVFLVKSSPHPFRLENNLEEMCIQVSKNVDVTFVKTVVNTNMSKSFCVLIEWPSKSTGFRSHAANTSGANACCMNPKFLLGGRFCIKRTSGITNAYFPCGIICHASMYILTLVAHACKHAYAFTCQYTLIRLLNKLYIHAGGFCRSLYCQICYVRVG